MLDHQTLVELKEVVRRPTRAAELAAYRAGKTLDDVQSAMIDQDSAECWRMYQDSANAAKSAQLANRDAYEAAYNSATLIGLSDIDAHALAMSLSATARDHAADAATSAAIHRRAHRLSIKAANDFSTLYN